ncbi:MAG: hypothetical protein IMX00_09965 [Limnochordales bacterium]|nr:hypothetical protein [Limnochordales bacterium]
MRFFDVLFGRSRLPQAKPEKLFSLVTAAFTLKEEAGWESAGRAGICLKAVAGSDFLRAREELEALLKLGVKETGGSVTVTGDEFGYLWVVVSDPDLDDQVNLVHMATQTLLEHGFGPQLLAAVFRFVPRPVTASVAKETEAGEGRAYLIYNYKRGNFYPFVPRSEKEKTREFEPELRVAAELEKELPIERDQTRWFALWNCPV